MRFRAGIQNINVFTKLSASLSSLGAVAWIRLSDTTSRFTVVPERGSQVWAVLQNDALFDDTFSIASAAPENSINLEVPLAPLHRALQSAQTAVAASIRLTKKDNVPLLSLTIATSAPLHHAPASSLPDDPATDHGPARDTIVTQDIPVRVLSPASVAGLHEPVCREPDVHIMLPPLEALKRVSERYARASPRRRLDMAANMHGCLRLGVAADEMRCESVWTGLLNPELDPGTVEGGEGAVEAHPSTRMKRLGDSQGVGEEGWATVRVDGRDWGRVLAVGRLGGRVIACFCHENALILYVYLASDNDETESVLTYYVTSYSE